MRKQLTRKGTKGDSATALKLAKVAHNQAVRAKEQIPAMKNAGPRF